MPGAVKASLQSRDVHHETINLCLDRGLILARPKGSESPACKNRVGRPKGVLMATRSRLTQSNGPSGLRLGHLRHEAIDRDLSLPEVALISGHRDHRMLLRYTHLRPENLVAKLDANP